MGQVQIFEEPKSGWRGLAEPETRENIRSIGETVASFRKNKHLNELSKKIAESQGHADQAQLYKMALQEDPNKLLKMLQIQDMVKRGGGQQGAIGVQGNMQGPQASPMGQPGLRAPPEQTQQQMQSPQMPGMSSGAPQGDASLQDPGNYSPGYDANTLQGITMLDPQTGNALTGQETLKAKLHENKVDKFQKDRDFYFKRAEPFTDALQKDEASLRGQEGQLSALGDSLTDVSGLNLNYIADKFGLPFLKDAAAGQFEAASKGFFLGDIKQAGARPNMYIEQQIKDMMPQFGKSLPANMAAYALIKYQHDILKNYADIRRRLYDEDIQKYGHPKLDIDNRAQKEAAKFALDETKRTEKRLREIKDKRLDPKSKEDFQVLQYYLKQAKGDEKKAMVKMRYDGYKW